MDDLTLAPGFPVGPLAPRPPRGPCEQDVSNMSASSTLVLRLQRQNIRMDKQRWNSLHWLVSLFSRGDAHGKVAGGKVSSFILFAQYETLMRGAHAQLKFLPLGLVALEGQIFLRFPADDKQRLRFRTKSSLVSSTGARCFHRLFFSLRILSILL